MPVGWPLSGGRVPTLAAGSKPEPVTVRVSPESAMLVVLDTSTCGSHDGVPSPKLIGVSDSWVASMAPLPGYTATAYWPAVVPPGATSSVAVNVPSGLRRMTSGLVPSGSRIAFWAAGTAHFWRRISRADDGAPADGFHGSPKRPKIT